MLANWIKRKGFVTASGLGCKTIQNQERCNELDACEWREAEGSMPARCRRKGRRRTAAAGAGAGGDDDLGDRIRGLPTGAIKDITKFL